MLQLHHLLADLLADASAFSRLSPHEHRELIGADIDLAYGEGKSA